MKQMGTFLIAALAFSTFAHEAKCDEPTKKMVISRLAGIVKADKNTLLSSTIKLMSSLKNKLAPKEVHEILDHVSTLRDVKFDCGQINNTFNTSFSREPFCALAAPKEASSEKSSGASKDLLGVFTALNDVIASYNRTHDKKRFIDDLKKLATDFGQAVKIYSKLPTGQHKQDQRKCASEKEDNPVCILGMLSHITHKIDAAILDDPDFIRAFSQLLQDVLYNVGYVTKNLHNFINPFAANINRITRDDYVEIKCGQAEAYYCGRALWPVTMEKHRTRIYIFRTKIGTDEPDEGFFQTLVHEAKRT